MAEIKTLCYHESRSTLISACEFEDCLVTLQKSIHRCEDNVTMAHLNAFHRIGVVRVLATIRMMITGSFHETWSLYM